MREMGIWIGRFQPPTKSHLVTGECILREWKRLTIGIVHGSPKPDDIDHKWSEYLDRPESNTLSDVKNPFRPDEVLRMWVQSLAHAGYLDRVTLVSMPRIPYQTDFTAKYPQDAYDFIEVAADGFDSPFDRLRSEAFEKLLGRPVFYVRPPFKLHNTQIKQMIAAKECGWRDVLPQGGYEEFISIGGPDRIKLPPG